MNDRQPAVASPAGYRLLRDVLAARSLQGSVVVAGHAGLDRRVARLNVMEVPDIGPWIKPDELLLTTAYPLRDRAHALDGFIAELDDAGLAGVAIKLGRYLDELPPAMVAEADARGLPIVVLPDDVAFDDILNDVLAGILNEQAASLARSERIHRSMLQLVLDGRGLDEIADHLAAIIEHPVAVIDPDGLVVASARLDDLGVMTGPDPLIIEMSGGSAMVGSTRLTCVAVPIVAGAREHGWVLALGPGAPPVSPGSGTADSEPTPVTDDRMALQSAATVVAVALNKASEVRAIEDKYRSDLVHDLLRGVDDVDDARRRARGFGWNLDRRTIVLVLRVDPAPGVDPASGRMRPVLSSIEPLVVQEDPHAAVVRFAREVVVIMGAFDGPDGRDHARAFTTRLARQTASTVHGTVSAGLSRPATELAAIRQAYDQAARALVIGRRIHGDGAVAHFDDLGAHRVLALVDDTAELDAFATEVLGALRTDDPATADLRATLRAVLDTGGNVAEAARRLHFHYNTLRYRIEKLTSILGPFTTDARVRLDVELALLIHDMQQLDSR